MLAHAEVGAEAAPQGSALERADIPKAANLNERIASLRKAAEQGNARAQANLGFAYMRGLGVPLDYVEAIKWSAKAAAAGVPTAHVNLGFLYATGLGGQRNYLLAYKHYAILAAA